MLPVRDHLIAFWLTPWSAPFRATCLWFTPDTQPLQGRRPNKIAPAWVRPFFLHAWVAEAIAARLKANPQTCAYLWGRASEPCYKADAWASYAGAVLRECDEHDLLNFFLLDTERLLRIAQEHPRLVGDLYWTGAALSASEHLAQVYAELKRRCKAQQARALVSQALSRFVSGPDADTDTAPIPENV